MQVPAGEIGVVIAQVGEPLPIGAKSGVYKPEFGNFSNLATVHRRAAGRRACSARCSRRARWCRSTRSRSSCSRRRRSTACPCRPSSCRGQGAGRRAARRSRSGSTPEQLRVVVIAPAGPHDMVGIVTALEGEPLPSGDIASRLGGYDDIAAMEASTPAAHATTDAEVIEVLLGSKNTLHNNYQDFQAFLEHGGKIGLQHDPLLYGAYLLNPFLVQVEMVPMLVVNQGEVAVDQGVRRPADARHVGHRVQVRLDRAARATAASGRSRCAPASTRSTRAATRPRSCRRRSSRSTGRTRRREAHNLDAQLAPIEGKSREGFVFRSSCRCRSTCPTPRRRRSSRWSARC